MNLRQHKENKAFYDWLISICAPNVVERLDGTLGDHEADRVLASFLDDVHSDGNIEVSGSFTSSKKAEINRFDEFADETWQLGTRYHPSGAVDPLGNARVIRDWEIETFYSLDELLAEVDNLTENCPEITINRFVGDAAVQNVKVEYAVGCRETGVVFDTFSDIEKALKLIEDYEKSDTEEGIFPANYYAHWAVPDTTDV